MNFSNLYEFFKYMGTALFIFTFIFYITFNYDSIFKIKKITLNNKRLDINLEKQLLKLNQYPNIFNFNPQNFVKILKQNQFINFETIDIKIKIPNEIQIISHKLKNYAKVQIINSKQSHFFLIYFNNKKVPISQKQFEKEKTLSIIIQIQYEFYNIEEKINKIIQSLKILKTWNINYLKYIRKIYYHDNNIKNFILLKDHSFKKIYFNNHLSLKDWVYIFIIFKSVNKNQRFKWNSIDLRFKPNFIVK